MTSFGVMTAQYQTASELCLFYKGLNAIIFSRED